LKAGDGPRGFLHGIQEFAFALMESRKNRRGGAAILRSCGGLARWYGLANRIAVEARPVDGPQGTAAVANFGRAKALESNIGALMEHLEDGVLDQLNGAHFGVELMQ
jgi:hypothetical protein